MGRVRQTHPNLAELLTGKPRRSLAVLHDQIEEVRLGSVDASAEAMRITRLVEAEFGSGSSQSGSAFLVAANRVLTCAHVVTSEAGEKAKRVCISTAGRPAVEATVVAIDTDHDLALLSSDEPARPPAISTVLPSVGQQVLFAGRPQGVRSISVFPGMVSAAGNELVRYPRCQLIQIAGMINNGNSGGPLLDVESCAVVGMVTAKYVPLLLQIDGLARGVKAIPQFPSSVGIGEIDFAKFVNLTIQSMWKLAAVLRLVQVGTGWAVPARHFARVGVK